LISRFCTQFKENCFSVFLNCNQPDNNYFKLLNNVDYDNIINNLYDQGSWLTTSGFSLLLGLPDEVNWQYVPYFNITTGYSNFMSPKANDNCYLYKDYNSKQDTISCKEFVMITYYNNVFTNYSTKLAGSYDNLNAGLDPNLSVALLTLNNIEIVLSGPLDYAPSAAFLPTFKATLAKIINYGPAIIALYISSNFQNYISDNFGIYDLANDTGSMEGGHCVQLVDIMSGSRVKEDLNLYYTKN